MQAGRPRCLRQEAWADGGRTGRGALAQTRFTGRRAAMRVKIEAPKPNPGARKGRQYKAQWRLIPNKEEKASGVRQITGTGYGSTKNKAKGDATIRAHHANAEFTGKPVADTPTYKE